MFNFKSKYYNSQEQKKFEQIFEAYFDPQNQNKTSTYLQILKKNKQIKFLTRAFVFTFPIVFGLYLLPGNQFKIQIQIKKIVRKSIVEFYKFIYDYSDITYKSSCTQHYILALNQQYMYFEDQEIEKEGIFQDIIKQYIFILNENQDQLEFALLHLDEFFLKVMERNRYHYFLENSTLLLDLLDIISRKLPDLDESQLQFKYSFEVQKLQPITTLICALFQYCLKDDERIEIYQYCMNLLKKNFIIANLLKQQFSLLLPIFYKDLARQEDQINFITIKFLVEFQNSLNNSDLLDKLLKDQLFSNLISVLDKKSNEFQKEFLNLMGIIKQNKEICYLMKETNVYDEEKNRLKNLKVNKELQLIIKQLLK